MLADQELFDSVEQELKKQGVIDRFEREQGKIRGRMMITVIDIPEELGIHTDPERQCFAFDGSFDFYDASIGIALYLNPIEFAGELWITPHTENAQPPAKEWIEFFVKTLMESISEDGSFGAPIYTFMSDTGDFKCIPTAE